MKKKIVISGIRPTGKLHLGNYFGAIQQFLELQKSEQCHYFVADLHALTTIQSQQHLRSNSLEIVKSYFACGIDPNKSIIYRQSDIEEIPYLSTILSMITPEGLLKRCTTFKDKAAKAEIISLGLLAYPVLMAADVLIIKSELVPVGEDQLQHLEIIRDIAQKFNHKFGNTFRLPEAQRLNSIRVPSLDGSNKMGKSENNTIDLLDSEKIIQKKVMSATTDLGPQQVMPPTMKNFYQLLKLCCEPSVYAEYLEKYESGEQKFYAAMKKSLSDAIIKITEPIKEKYYSNELSDSKIIEILNENAKKIRNIAKPFLAEVQEKVGITI